MSTQQNYTTFIEASLNEAAAIANRNYDKVTSSSVKSGDNNQVLTETDLEVGKLIVEKIQAAYSDYNIIDEEAGVIDKKSKFTWVVDPIDGTSNFANGLPTYGIMVGLLEDDQPIAGGIVLPALNQVYLAQKGQGSFCNGQPIHVTEEKKLLNTLIAYGIDGHQEDPQRTHDEMKILTTIVLNIRNLRTTNSAYDMVQVPAGRYGAMLNQTTKIWDNVAFHVLVEEAGGVMTDFWGKPLDYSNPLSRAADNFTICAASPELHEQLQEIIQSV